jgi:hypothetical protein
MRNAVEAASVTYAVTYLGGILAGFPWDKLASALTAMWFAVLLAEKGYNRFIKRKVDDASPES